MTAATSAIEAFFLQRGDDRRFALHHVPAATTGCAWIFLHAFAEEMNFSRRACALQARALAGAGSAVLQFDLAGCGDSDGEFADATWSRWVEDGVAAVDWLARRTGSRVGLCGLRAGCLLACDVAARLGMSVPLLLCAPISDGESHWRQFRRLGRIGSAMSAAKADADSMAGATEIAGYVVSDAMRDVLCAARLQLPANISGVGIIDIAPAQAPGSAIVEAMSAEASKRAEMRFASERVESAPFWQIPETDDCTGIEGATLRIAAAIS